MSRHYRATGEDIWKNKIGAGDKINAELFTLTYGSIVSQLVEDFNGNYDEVNKQLFQMGRNMGVRLIDEFLSVTQLPRCSSFKETGEVVSKIAFKMFLNITPNVEFDSDINTYINSQGSAADGSPAIGSSGQAAGSNPSNLNIPDSEVKSFTLLFDENPLTDFVELPEQSQSSKSGPVARLWYSNVLCGVLKGALEMIQLETRCYFISDVLNGDDTTALRVDLLQVLRDEIPAGDD